MGWKKCLPVRLPFLASVLVVMGDPTRPFAVHPQPPRPNREALSAMWRGSHVDAVVHRGGCCRGLATLPPWHRSLPARVRPSVRHKHGIPGRSAVLRYECFLKKNIKLKKPNQRNHLCGLMLKRAEWGRWLPATVDVAVAAACERAAARSWAPHAWRVKFVRGRQAGSQSG